MSNLFLDEYIENLYCYKVYGEANSETNYTILRLAKKQLMLILENECTERQKEVVKRRINGEKLINISEDLGISVSTISRHCNKGFKTIHRYAQYIEPFLRRNMKCDGNCFECKYDDCIANDHRDLPKDKRKKDIKDKNTTEYLKK